MIQISTHTGSEGPRHDPYHYEEFTVERDGRSVTVHHGLGTWVEMQVPNKSECHFDVEDQDIIDAIFISVVGTTEAQARRWQRKAEAAKLRAHRGHGAGEWVRGFPGESLYMCSCGDVLDSCFSQSAIE